MAEHPCEEVEVRLFYKTDFYGGILNDVSLKKNCNFAILTVFHIFTIRFPSENSKIPL
jgi:hypothetical protein